MATLLDIGTLRETVLVTTRGKMLHFGKDILRDNVAALDWHMPTSPQHFAISVHKDSLTATLIHESKVFVVNFISVDFAEKVKQIGSISGKVVDKFSRFGIAKEEAEGVDCCRVKDAVAYIGCHVVQQMEFEKYVLFIGKVVVLRDLVPGAKRLFHVKENEFTTTKD
jgi:flavin reductase (DIM6/NTAB) family NADH-FMN oxidoreductase RutF